jgi:hypothetical protein
MSRMLARPDGTADYDVAVQINTLQLAHFQVKNFPRNAGWAKLLERIGQLGQQYDDKGNAWFKAVCAAEEEVRGKEKDSTKRRRVVRKHCNPRP